MPSAPWKTATFLQSTEIERDAFPSLFPPTSFRRELQNRTASYLVAARDDTAHEVNVSAVSPAHEESRPAPLIRRLLHNARTFGSGGSGGPGGSGVSSARQPTQGFIAGFMGIWYVVEEAHIVTFGVRSDYRGRGIGELLLIAAIEQAAARQANVVTLEVRVSNHVAKNLYRKYGFRETRDTKGVLRRQQRRRKHNDYRSYSCPALPRKVQSASPGARAALGCDPTGAVLVRPSVGAGWRFRLFRISPG